MTPGGVVLGLGRGLGAALATLLVLPVFALLVFASPGEISRGLQHPAVLPALHLSLTTSIITLGILLVAGTPLAWWLAQRHPQRPGLMEVLVQLPIVVPPAVAGLGLLLVFGRNGLVGRGFVVAGVSVAFTPVAVVLAQVLTAAPFYVLAAASAFRSLDGRLLVVARSLGASQLWAFVTVGLPQAAPSLLAGAALAWARALGEFGATLMFAGNLPGRTQTLPLAVYTAMEMDMNVAVSIAVVLLVVAFGLLAVVWRTATARAEAH